MKAVVLAEFGPAEVLQATDAEDPQPGPDEVLIETHAVGVNFADTKAREGLYPVGVEPPLILGMEVAGTVRAVGSEVRSVREGDRVAAFTGRGGYAELATAKAQLTWSVPESVDLDEAVAVPLAGVTAYNTLTLAGRLQPEESVLVHSAAGGVGSTAVQIARALGARQIIGTVGTEEKERLAREAGCDDVIVRDRDDLAERARELTEDRGVDLALDPIAGPLFPSTLDCVADFGRLVVFGTSGGSPGSVTTDLLHQRNRAVIGYSNGGHVRGRPQVLSAAGEALLGLLEKSEVKIRVGGEYPFDEAPEAHRALESGQTLGKLLLRP